MYLFFDKEVKLPSSDLSMTQDEKDTCLRNLVYDKWKEINSSISPDRIDEYEDGIEYELNAITETKNDRLLFN